MEDVQDVFPILMQRPFPTEQTVLKGLSGVREEIHERDSGDKWNGQDFQD